MEIVDFGPLTAEQKQELEGDEDDPFDARGVTLKFRQKDQHVAVRDDTGRLVASTGLVIAEVEVTGRRFPVVGVGGVFVNAEHRGRGLARMVLDAALQRASALGPDFALLFCYGDRAGLYRKLGFADVTAEVIVGQPVGTAVMPQHTMWRALHDGGSWPDGRVVVHGLPF